MLSCWGLLATLLVFVTVFLEYFNYCCCFLMAIIISILPCVMDFLVYCIVMEFWC